jgi:hypothetical protein
MPKWKRVWAWVSSSDDEVPDRHQVKKSHQPRMSEFKAMESGELKSELSASLPIQSNQVALIHI